MTLKIIATHYDTTTNQTKIFLEDINEQTSSHFQEIVHGDVTQLSEKEQMNLALDSHYKRYYQEQATQNLISKLDEKSKNLDKVATKFDELKATVDQLLLRVTTLEKNGSASHEVDIEIEE